MDSGFLWAVNLRVNGLCVWCLWWTADLSRVFPLPLPYEGAKNKPPKRTDKGSIYDMAHSENLPFQLRFAF